jgi:hypothetical protein
MLITEEEAKKCACTISEMYAIQVSAYIKNGSNKINEIHPSFEYGNEGQRVAFKRKCIASKCSMWQMWDSFHVIRANKDINFGYCPFAEKG